eukprot:7968847-Ditylum_brightwellii.AAC.1
MDASTALVQYFLQRHHYVQIEHHYYCSDRWVGMHPPRIEGLQVHGIYNLSCWIYCTINDGTLKTSSGGKHSGASDTMTLLTNLRIQLPKEDFIWVKITQVLQYLRRCYANKLLKYRCDGTDTAYQSFILLC